VVRFCNKRYTAEQWIKEAKQAVKMTRLSCRRFRSNEVRLALSLLAFNLDNLWRRLVLPKKIDHWSLTSLQQRPVKTGRRLTCPRKTQPFKTGALSLVKHAGYNQLQLSEGHLTRKPFASIARRTAALPAVSG